SYFPKTSDVSQFHNNLEMVKIGVLYADHSKLVSVPAFALLVDAPREIENPDPIAYLRNRILWSHDEEEKKNLAQAVEQFERAKQRRYSRRGRERFRKLNEWFMTQLQETKARWTAEASEPGAREVREALDSGFVEIHAF